MLVVASQLLTLCLNNVDIILTVFFMFEGNGFAVPCYHTTHIRVFISFQKDVKGPHRLLSSLVGNCCIVDHSMF